MSLLGQSLCFCSQPPQGLLLQGFGEPSCSPAAVLGSDRLMETFIPAALLHHPAASPEKPPALPMPPPALPTDISFLHPSTGLPQDGPLRSGAKLQRHWTGQPPPRGLGRTSTSLGAAAGPPPPPRGQGLHGPRRSCSSALQTEPAGPRITYCRDPKITGTVSHSSWGLGDAQSLSSGKLNLGLFLDEVYKYRGKES